jgi:cyclopropane-fatty-acyl-phospholipid synthase
MSDSKAYAGAPPSAIEFHYDMPPEFFRLWLGETMTYTAARFDTNSDGCNPNDLDRAQKAKMRWHLEGSGLRRDGRYLDIGCGWGSLMKEAGESIGAVEVIGLTLSRKQYEYVQSMRLSNVTAYVESYEYYTPERKFDAISSVGAFEHFARPGISVEQKLLVYRNFFRCCHEWLRDGSQMTLQTITWGDISTRQVSHESVSEFFPNSSLPFIEDVIVSSKPWFELVAMENRCRDYELTCKTWLLNLRAHRNEGIRLVGAERQSFYERCMQGGALLFRRRNYNLCRFVFKRLPSRLLKNP